MPSAEFTEATLKVKDLTKLPSNDNLLKFYGLFKIVTVGPNKTERPGMFDPKGKAKWDKWTEYNDLSPEEAEKQYIALYKELAAL
ncbi:hypothetical protein BGW38_007396 [Lunasporangiospora selenospora]|uniref:ACB domain-containing protein n=1 Tax=Lunasporangiospora selenospora TaxID=979761 RepID=A0A9P6K9Q4_9FUNG|nr:hypothetical protein BGW38_007396 [Lunasporangiospora selenospora]